MVERRPLIAMVVNNAVAHDARVIKTALTLSRAGADVRVLGVSSSGLRERAVSGSGSAGSVPGSVPGPAESEAGSRCVSGAVGSGSVVFERLPVLPPRSVTPGYVMWAATRRFGRAFPADRWKRSIPVTGYYHRAFLPALQELAPDVVHVHDIHLLAVVAEYAAGASPRPHVVYDAHEFVAGLAVSGARTQRSVDGWAALERQFIRSADRVITVADGLAERLQALHHLDRRPAVVHNAPIAWGRGTGTAASAGPGGDAGSDAGASADADPGAADGGSAADTDMGARSSRSLREECGIGADVTLAVYSGALSAARGVDTAVQALGLLPDLHLAVVAVPFPHPMEARLREIAVRAGAADRLHFVPPVPSHEVPSYLSQADVAVSPILGDSVSYDEALPNKLFEFLHAGLPMVVSDCRAVAQFVTDHGLGAVFRAGDPDDLARGLREVLADPPHPDTTELRREYSWQGQEPHLIAVYDELVPGLRIPDAPIAPEDLKLSWSRV